MKSRFENLHRPRLASRVQLTLPPAAQNTRALFKEALLREFNAESSTDGRLIRLALNEAEALACQSGFPALIFPLLAIEKAQAVRAWSKRQSAMTSNNRAFAFAE